MKAHLVPLAALGRGTLARTHAGSADEPLVAVAMNHGSLHLPSETHIRAHVAALPARVLITRTLHGPVSGERGPLLSYAPTDRLARLLARASGRTTQAEIEARALAAYWRDAGVALVLAQYGTNGVAAMEACRLARLPLVVHFRGFDVYDTRTVEPLRAAYRHLFDVAGRCLAPSAHMADELASLGANRARIDVVPSGADLALFRPTEAGVNPPVLITCGRLVPKKAPLVTLRAFAAVLAAEPSARLRVIGDGELRGACESLVHELGIAHAVQLRGARSHAEVAEAMRGARAVVLHSVVAPDGDSEGLPGVLQEAGACELPVVSTRHRGIPELVLDGETGLLVDEQDVAGMAAAMLRLVRDPELATSLGRAAGRRVRERYSRAAAVAGIWNTCQRAMREHGARPG